MMGTTGSCDGTRSSTPCGLEDQSEFTLREQQLMSDHMIARRMQEEISGFPSVDYYQDAFDASFMMALQQEEAVVRDQIVASRVQEELSNFLQDEMLAQRLQNEETAFPAHAADAQHDNLPIIDTCVVCVDDNVKGFTLACGHKQCIDCMRDNFKAALDDRSLLPLVCCSVPIDMNCALTLLTPDEADRILLHDVEKATSNKMFCPKCGAFINLDLLDNSESKDLLCYDCNTRLCTACHKEAHDKLTCREYQETMTGTDELLLEHAKKQGWKQCPQCNMMVERNQGCKFIYCGDCKKDFCYKCGTQCAVRHKCPTCGNDPWDH